MRNTLRNTRRNTRRNTLHKRRHKARRNTRRRRQNGGNNINRNNLEIVVSRFNEDLSWLKEIPTSLYTKITVYNKNDTPIECPVNKCTVHQLPNLGRESHSYFHHVIQNYDNLADITLFLPASVFNKPHKKSQYDHILNFLSQKHESVIIGGKKDRANINTEKTFTIDEHALTNVNNRAKNPNSRLDISHLRPLGRWFEHFFPGEEIRCITYNGIFAASRDDIRKRSKDLYMQLLENHSTKNPETVHYSERTWASIFSIPNCI
jgi:hypothetical protein